MDISHLKTFLEIYQIRHFGKAADKLFITQSAASARIKLLEEQLGVRLFIRDKRNIEPTPAGHRFYKYAEMTVKGWEQAKRVVALPDEVHQSLAVACMADIWHLFLNQWMVDIGREQTEVAYNLSICRAHSIIEQLISGAIDLGFVFEPSQIPALDAKLITTFELRLFSTHPGQSYSDVMNEDYIMVDWGAEFAYEYAQHFTELKYATVKTSYGIMALDLMKRRGGSAYLPEQILNDPEKTVELYPVADAPVFTRKLHAVYARNSFNLDVIKSFIRIISATG